nr:MAG TPA: hypothetical protein [Caudoviricetes sp.]DAV20476.1 MAG TPA: hypothetical protein [Caudoviricetes sp.]
MSLLFIQLYQKCLLFAKKYRRSDSLDYTYNFKTKV